MRFLLKTIEAVILTYVFFSKRLKLSFWRMFSSQTIEAVILTYVFFSNYWSCHSDVCFLLKTRTKDLGGLVVWISNVLRIPAYRFTARPRFFSATQIRCQLPRRPQSVLAIFQKSRVTCCSVNIRLGHLYLPPNPDSSDPDLAMCSPPFCFERNESEVKRLSLRNVQFLRVIE